MSVLHKSIKFTLILANDMNLIRQEKYKATFFQQRKQINMKPKPVKDKQFFKIKLNQLICENLKLHLNCVHYILALSVTVETEEQ